MYLALYVTKYRQTYRQLYLKLRRALYRQLNSALNLDLNLNLYSYLNLNLNLNLNPQSYRSLFVSSFGALYRKKYRSFDGSVYPALSPQLQLPRRPLGRGVGGRIVARNDPATTYRRCPGRLFYRGQVAGAGFRPPLSASGLVPASTSTSTSALASPTAPPPPSSPTGIPACRDGRSGRQARPMTAPGSNRPPLPG